ncbi:MAG: hypothetical protein ACHQRK_11965, partial [Gemmatimonadales bacterium]
SVWEAGLVVVRRGETTMDELRRVAAQPVRVVTEPAPAAVLPRRRIGCRDPFGADAEPRLLRELTEAAAALGGEVDICSLGGGPPPVGALDAVVFDGPAPAREGRGGPLVVALAPDASAGDHVRTLAHDADLVLSQSAHGRFLLATILALLRWRSR